MDIKSYFDYLYTTTKVIEASIPPSGTLERTINDPVPEVRYILVKKITLLI